MAQQTALLRLPNEILHQIFSYVVLPHTVVWNGRYPNLHCCDDVNTQNCFDSLIWRRGNTTLFRVSKALSDAALAYAYSTSVFQLYLDEFGLDLSQHVMGKPRSNRLLRWQAFRVDLKLDSVLRYTRKWDIYITVPGAALSDESRRDMYHGPTPFFWRDDSVDQKLIVMKDGVAEIVQMLKQADILEVVRIKLSRTFSEIREEITESLLAALREVSGVRTAKIEMLWGNDELTHGLARDMMRSSE
ncbi:MAG: hypothetical protein M1820_000109 [Bogoriella megaspora]|nr:MAG: hypothetical protein M1820_000109 [Bogoriella megaspora]